MSKEAKFDIRASAVGLEEKLKDALAAASEINAQFTVYCLEMALSDLQQRPPVAGKAGQHDSIHH